MSKYCPECGEKLDDENTSFCHNCGKPQNEERKENNNNILIMGLAGVIIILLIGIVLLTNGIALTGDATSILIISDSPVSNSEEFQVELTDNNAGIPNKPLEITFKNDKDTYTFNTTTDYKGFASVIPNVEAGDYEVTVTFKGDNEYRQSSVSSQMTVDSHTTQIDSQVTSTRNEPDYESFSYSHSFEDTDKNGDGYVYLSDMNIAHTPKNIINQMFADSDSNGDGKLNHDEYYKFMYKLNYDKDSYGL